MAETNTLAYYDEELVTVVKYFIVQGPIYKTFYGSILWLFVIS